MHLPYNTVKPYTTKDGSIIRELVHPDHHPCSNLSLAEALIPAVQKTLLHKHGKTEEIYHISSGKGCMTLGSKSFAVRKGDTILIPPGTAHCIENTENIDLMILCSCAPAYAHDDTILL